MAELEIHSMGLLMPKVGMRTVCATCWQLCSHAMLNRLSARTAEYLATFDGNVLNPTKAQLCDLRFGFWKGVQTNRKGAGDLRRAKTKPLSALADRGFGIQS